MAERNRAHTHRHDEAQPADQHSGHDLARQARARMRRAKEAIRCRHREHAALATEDGERAGPGTGDRQGEVA
ncbi:hypothetical protein [Halococcus sediminicola]|uniref:hypothetical protein n=1 Tax=Halococcus sediminicola TaxID=1264579 RepID=UPI000679D051|nr:hypothetical protein [Halococcus sediminicola]